MATLVIHESLQLSPKRHDATCVVFGNCVLADRYSVACSRFLRHIKSPTPPTNSGNQATSFHAATEIPVSLPAHSQRVGQRSFRNVLNFRQHCLNFFPSPKSAMESSTGYQPDAMGDKKGGYPAQSGSAGSFDDTLSSSSGGDTVFAQTGFQPNRLHPERLTRYCILSRLWLHQGQVSATRPGWSTRSTRVATPQPS